LPFFKCPALYPAPRHKKTTIAGRGKISTGDLDTLGMIHALTFIAATINRILPSGLLLAFGIWKSDYFPKIGV
jgi:hypothetical protein